MVLALTSVLGCERPATPADASQPRDRIASLSPAATDILLELGERDRLVAVSNYEPPRETTDRLPRVGDYQTTDWEKLTELRPRFMVVQMAPDRMPQGMTERAGKLGIRLINVKIDSLADIDTAMLELARTLNIEHRARKSISERILLENELERRMDGRQTVKTLIVLNSEASYLAGRGTFLDALVTHAGGVNALPEGTRDYPTVDREALLALNPSAIIQVLPGASESEKQRARDVWRSLRQLDAVRDDRILIVTDPFAMIPGPTVMKLARPFAEFLHPEAFKPR
jgi:iron complex transport system substrate-binding protein